MSKFSGHHLMVENGMGGFSTGHFICGLLVDE